MFSCQRIWWPHDGQRERGVDRGPRLPRPHRPTRSCLDRFILVLHDAYRTLICCIDPVDADHVSVTDLVTTVTPDGLRTQIGSYRKLRLAPADEVG